MYRIIIDQAVQFAEMLHIDNSDRKEADQSITVEALKIINENAELGSEENLLLFISRTGTKV